MDIKLYDNTLTSLHIDPQAGQIIQASPYSPATHVSIDPKKRCWDGSIIGYVMGQLHHDIPGHVNAGETLVEQIIPYQRENESQFMIPYSRIERWSSSQTGKYQLIGQIEGIENSFEQEGELEGLLLLSTDQKQKLRELLEGQLE